MDERPPLSGPPGVARIFAQAWDAFARRDVAAFREFVTDDIEFHGRRPPARGLGGAANVAAPLRLDLTGAVVQAAEAARAG